MRPRVLRELSDATARPRSETLETSWRLGKVSECWRKANASRVIEQGKKEDLGAWRPVSLTSSPASVMEQIILEAISRHMKDK